MPPPKKTESTKKSTDEIALDLVRDIARRKDEIAKAEKIAWQTNGALSLNGATINLHVAGATGDVSELVMIGGMLLRMQDDYVRASDFFLVENPQPLKVAGYPVHDWLADVRARITKVQIKAKREKLEKLEARANAILTPEMKAKLELEALQAELGS